MYGRDLLIRLASSPAVLVTVQAHRGSVPRELGAWMAVFAQTTVGSIGGGHLECQAIAQARAWLGGQVGAALQSYKLGPGLGQCCGGELQLRFEAVSAADVPALQQRFAAEQSRWPVVALFGAGHVGAALVQVLGRLPLQLRWIDSREGIFPEQVPGNVVCEHSDPVHLAVAQLPARAHVLIMSFSHAQDLDLVMACLKRQRLLADFGLIGLIGSQTKWATFSHRLLARGFVADELAQVTCPIGLPGINGKEPEVIAVAVAAQVLQVLQAKRTAGQASMKDT